MKNPFRNITYVLTVLVIQALLSSCTTSAETPEEIRHALRLEPTGIPVAFDGSVFSSFDDYIKDRQSHLAEYKVFQNPNNREEELKIAAPFRIDPFAESASGQCKKQTGATRGIVLIHGLSDMPAAMKDLAHAFAVRCFVTYSVLLPGHGARASEMLEVSRHDWIAAVQFAVDAMGLEVDEVYVGGFSLGGLLAVQTAINNADVAGVFGFSPALSLHRSFFLNQTVWIRLFKDWLDTDPPDDPWRFESIPFNAIAETQVLSKSVRNQLKTTALNVPVFIAQSPDDAIVDAAANQRLFENHMIHPDSRLLSYSDTVAVQGQDKRILKYSSLLPEENILSYAHQAVHISPKNTHYGVDGSYRNCNNDINTSKASVNHCLTVVNPFRGEVFGSAVSRYKHYDFDSMARLTFNPQFDELMAEIDYFVASVSDKKESQERALFDE